VVPEAFAHPAEPSITSWAKDFKVIGKSSV